MVIDPQRVKRAVYNRIDFELPEETWKEINDAFCTCWNEVIGFGNEVDSIEVKNYIADWLRKPCQTLSQKKLSLKEMRKQFQENNPKGFRGFNQAEPENIKGQETKQSKP